MLGPGLPTCVALSTLLPAVGVSGPLHNGSFSLEIALVAHRPGGPQICSPYLMHTPTHTLSHTLTHPHTHALTLTHAHMHTIVFVVNIEVLGLDWAL